MASMSTMKRTCSKMETNVKVEHGGSGTPCTNISSQHSLTGRIKSAEHLLTLSSKLTSQFIFKSASSNLSGNSSVIPTPQPSSSPKTECQISTELEIPGTVSNRYTASTLMAKSMMPKSIANITSSHALQASYAPLLKSETSWNHNTVSRENFHDGCAKSPSTTNLGAPTSIVSSISNPSVQQSSEVGRIKSEIPANVQLMSPGNMDASLISNLLAASSLFSFSSIPVPQPSNPLVKSEMPVDHQLPLGGITRNRDATPSTPSPDFVNCSSSPTLHPPSTVFVKSEMQTDHQCPSLGTLRNSITDMSAASDSRSFNRSSPTPQPFSTPMVKSEMPGEHQLPLSGTLNNRPATLPVQPSSTPKSKSEASLDHQIYNKPSHVDLLVHSIVDSNDDKCLHNMDTDGDRGDFQSPQSASKTSDRSSSVSDNGVKSTSNAMERSRGAVSQKTDNASVHGRSNLSSVRIKQEILEINECGKQDTLASRRVKELGVVDGNTTGPFMKNYMTRAKEGCISQSDKKDSPLTLINMSVSDKDKSATNGPVEGEKCRRRLIPKVRLAKIGTSRKDLSLLSDLRISERDLQIVWNINRKRRRSSEYISDDPLCRLAESTSLEKRIKMEKDAFFCQSVSESRFHAKSELPVSTLSLEKKSCMVPSVKIEDDHTSKYDLLFGNNVSGTAMLNGSQGLVRNITVKKESYSSEISDGLPAYCSSDTKSYKNAVESIGNRRTMADENDLAESSQGMVSKDKNSNEISNGEFCRSTGSPNRVSPKVLFQGRNIQNSPQEGRCRTAAQKEKNAWNDDGKERTVTNDNYPQPQERRGKRKAAAWKVRSRRAFVSGSDDEVDSEERYFTDNDDDNTQLRRHSQRAAAQKVQSQRACISDSDDDVDSEESYVTDNDDDKPKDLRRSRRAAAQKAQEQSAWIDSDDTEKSDVDSDDDYNYVLYKKDKQKSCMVVSGTDNENHNREQRKTRRKWRRTWFSDTDSEDEDYTYCNPRKAKKMKRTQSKINSYFTKQGLDSQLHHGYLGHSKENNMECKNSTTVAKELSAPCSNVSVNAKSTSNLTQNICKDTISGSIGSCRNINDKQSESTIKGSLVSNGDVFMNTWTTSAQCNNSELYNPGNKGNSTFLTLGPPGVHVREGVAVDEASGVAEGNPPESSAVSREHSFNYFPMDISRDVARDIPGQPGRSAPASLATSRTGKQQMTFQCDNEEDQKIWFQVMEFEKNQEEIRRSQRTAPQKAQSEIAWFDKGDDHGRQKSSRTAFVHSSKSAWYSDSEDSEYHENDYHVIIPRTQIRKEKSTQETYFYERVLEKQSQGQYPGYAPEDISKNVTCQFSPEIGYVRFICKICNKDWRRFQVMVIHAISHLKENRHFCKKCGRIFFSKACFEVHSDFHRLGMWQEIEGSGSRRYTCAMCHKFFASKELLTIHSKGHAKEARPFECGVCGKKFSTSRQRGTHEWSHKTKERKIKCPLCPATSASRSCLKNHLQIHKLYNSDINGYRCDHCEATYSSLAKLELHRKIHTANAVCERCGEAFKSTQVLKHHMDTCITKDPTLGRYAKIHKCEVCGKKFFLPALVKRHMLVHTRERNYGCKYCDMAFQQSGARDRHQALHFKDGKYREVKKHTIKVKKGRDGRIYN